MYRLVPGNIVIHFLFIWIMKGKTTSKVLYVCMNLGRDYIKNQWLHRLVLWRSMNHRLHHGIRDTCNVIRICIDVFWFLLTVKFMFCVLLWSFTCYLFWICLMLWFMWMEALRGYGGTSEMWSFLLSNTYYNNWEDFSVTFLSLCNILKILTLSFLFWDRIIIQHFVL